MVVISGTLWGIGLRIRFVGEATTRPVHQRTVTLRSTQRSLNLKLERTIRAGRLLLFPILTEECNVLGIYLSSYDETLALCS